MLVQHHVFYVTGGASGLGLATVRAIVKEGGYVAVLDMDVEGGEKIEMELKELVKFVRCDVRSEDDVAAAIKSIDKVWGDRKVGGVVHCGGVGMVGKTDQTLGANNEPFSLDTFRETIDINLVGSFNVARLVAQRIASSFPPPKSHRHPDSPDVTDDRGVIILTSSVSYEEGQMGQAAYASSKAGVAGLVLPMARDLARHGIRVVAIAPSIFETAMGAHTSPKVKASLLATSLFPARMGHADEFAHLAMAVIGNQMLNGSVLRLDGGSRMAKM
ncbi:hypothetical protein MNV49_002958 [Pseudohyphozyma bogoriensis]|nr:hypothetical protein MNV49_002958 [Pseudohyphozyma bogoriensis]